VVSPVLQGTAVKIFLASASSGIRAMWPNSEKRRAWTMANRCGRVVARLGHNWSLKTALANTML